ncbi:MAG: stage III sporulation protein AA [Oscillibacter sp.]
MLKQDLEGNLLRYEQAAAFLPLRLRKLAGLLSDQQRAAAEEFRLRTGRPMTVLLPDGEWETGGIVEAEDLEMLCNLATEFSRYAAAETIREGYLPVRGGFRVGLCGTAVVKDGGNTNLKDLSSAVIRIAREMRGIATELAPGLFREGRFVSTLILSPPGGGKTTLLRDLVRCISEGAEGQTPCRVALIDERGEVAVMYRGEAQMDVGAHTDVLDGCPKALGIPMVLRAMNPQIIAVDEITRRADLEAISMANGCGVGLLATIHAENIAELLEKPLYADLLAKKVFGLAVRIEKTPAGRGYRVEDLPC